MMWSWLPRSWSRYEAAPSEADAQRTALDPSQSLLEKGASWVSAPTSTSQRRQYMVHALIITFEVVVALVLVGLSLGLHSDKTHTGLEKLAFDSTSYTFGNHSHLLRDTQQGNSYWHELLASGGVVSLDTQWALAQGLSKSSASPTDATQSIYQVDVFHALHCLDSIRKNLLAESKPAWDAVHVEHCLDYLRGQLLCHPDLTLVPTHDMSEFVLTERHQCRDFAGVEGWVQEHRWREFGEWVRNKSMT